MKSIVMVLMLLVQLGYANGNYYYKNNQKVYLTQVTSMTEVTSDINYYKNDKGILLGITDKVIVKTVDIHLLKEYVHELNASIEKKLAKDLYLIKVISINKTLDIANALDEKESIEYAHPDFIKKRMSR